MKYFFVVILVILFGCLEVKSQGITLNPDSVIYKKSWSAGARLRSDGFSLGAEITRSKRFKRSLLFQIQFSYFIHPKQTRQNSLYGGGGFFGDGFKPFIFGKQNSLFTLYAGVGQKHLLAEKARKHGVQIFAKYAGGFSLAILKPYSLQVLNADAQTFDDYKDITYDENSSTNGFLDVYRILGASGFGKGWKLKVLPALHIEVAMEFDWAKNESFIKALEIGIASDFYYKNVPVMIEKNRFMYPSVFVGFNMGKRSR